MSESHGAPPLPPPGAKGPSRRSVTKAAAVWSVVAVFVGAMIVIANMNWSADTGVVARTYTEFMAEVRADRVERISIDATTGAIAGTRRRARRSRPGARPGRCPSRTLPSSTLTAWDATTRPHRAA